MTYNLNGDSLPSNGRPSPHGLPVAFENILDAAGTLKGVVRSTPIMTSRTLDRRAGGSIFLKCENFQRTGAFKIRGAYNALSRLSDERRAAGVVTYSSGNHAQAVALSGSLLDIRTTIVMPDNAPEIKRRATEAYGADIVSYDPQTATREDIGRDLAAEHGYTLIPPYDHPDVIAGQGTVGLEFMQSIHELDLLLVCCGGGGLLSGCAIAAHHMNPSCRVVGVEPANADDATRSFRTGTLQTVHNPDTIADGARTPYLGDLTFPLVLKHVDDMVTVSEDAIIRAMRFLWERMKMVVEPTGALATAAVLDGVVNAEGKRVGAVISGGNVDLERAFQLFASLKGS